MFRRRWGDRTRPSALGMFAEAGRVGCCWLEVDNRRWCPVSLSGAPVDRPCGDNGRPQHLAVVGGRLSGGDGEPPPSDLYFSLGLGTKVVEPSRFASGGVSRGDQDTGSVWHVADRDGTCHTRSAACSGQKEQFDAAWSAPHEPAPEDSVEPYVRGSGRAFEPPRRRTPVMSPARSAGWVEPAAGCLVSCVGVHATSLCCWSRVPSLSGARRSHPSSATGVEGYLVTSTRPFIPQCSVQEYG